MSGAPHPKSEQLARGPKRAARVKATREEWARIIIAKAGPCRTRIGEGFSPCEGRTEFHHLVPRGWLGDDVEDNIVPLCARHHRHVTERNDKSPALGRLAVNLTDAEYAYVISKLGEGALERLFGVMGRAGAEHGA